MASISRDGNTVLRRTGRMSTSSNHFRRSSQTIEPADVQETDLIHATRALHRRATLPSLTSKIRHSVSVGDLSGARRDSKGTPAQSRGTGLQQLGAYAALPPGRVSPNTSQRPTPRAHPENSGVLTTPLKSTVYDDRTRMLRGFSAGIGIPFDVIQNAAETWEKHAEIPDDPPLNVVRNKWGDVVAPVDKNIFKDGLMDRKYLQKVSGSVHDVAPSSGKTTKMTFKEFAILKWSLGFSEEFCVSPRTQELRKTARRLDISYNDLEKYKDTFDHFDKDSNGYLTYQEFTGVLTELTKVPPGTELPKQRVLHLWQICDLDGNGKLDFEEFVVFYRKYFSEGNGEICPFEEFYAKAAQGVAGFGGISWELAGS